MTGKNREYFSGDIRKSPSERGRGDGPPRSPYPPKSIFQRGRDRFGEWMDAPYTPHPRDSEEERRAKALRGTAFDPYDDCA